MTSTDNTEEDENKNTTTTKVVPRGVPATESKSIPDDKAENYTDYFCTVMSSGNIRISITVYHSDDHEDICVISGKNIHTTIKENEIGESHPGLIEAAEQLSESWDNTFTDPHNPNEETARKAILNAENTEETSQNNDPHDDEYVSRQEFIEYALEYRDEMIKSLGVVGVEGYPNHFVPGEEVRRIPTNTTGMHDSIGDKVGSHRILTDTRDYIGKSALAESPLTKYTTIAETTGHAAIHSSATVYGWSTIPTPREISLAEYLYNINESDADPKIKIPVSKLGTRIIERLFPQYLTHDTNNFWKEPRETPIDNVIAAKQSVSALTHTKNEGRILPIKYKGKYEGEENDSLQSRLEAGNIIIERHSENTDPREKSGTWYNIYIENHKAEVTGFNGLGYVTFEVEEEDVEKPVEVETSMKTIPELLHPEHVLNIPTSDPKNPKSLDQ